MYRSEAIALARAEISRICGSDDEMTVIEESVVERDWGWFIPWSSTEDLVLGLPPAPGIAPFIVLRSSRKLQMIATGALQESVLRILGLEAGNELISTLTSRKPLPSVH